MIRTHSLLVILAIFLSAFSCIHFMSTFFSGHRHLSRSDRISCPVPHLERTDNKPFSGLIGPRHKTKSWVVPRLGEMLPSRSVIQPKHLNTILRIWFLFSQGHQNNNNNDSLLLLFDALWIVKAGYMVQEDKLKIFYFSQ